MHWPMNHHMNSIVINYGTEEFVDEGKNPSQQWETLLVPQVPIRLTNVWCGRLDGIMDPLPFYAFGYSLL